MSTSAWLPMAKTAASGSARRVMVKLQAMLPDWVTIATPRVAGLDAVLVGPQSRAAPCR